MNILVCFKTVPELERLTREDWVADSHLRVDTGFVTADLNPYDESALEMALRLSDQSGESGTSCTLTALTIGDSSRDPWLKKLYALKFDRAVRLECDADLRFSPEVTARLLAGYIQENRFDVILLGCQGGVGDNGMTPFLLAEYLAWPLISHAVEIRPASGNTLWVKSDADDEFLVQEAGTPLVISIGDSPNSYMRIPTLKDKLEYGRRSIEVLQQKAPETGNGNFCGTLVDLERLDYTRKGHILKGASPRDTAAQLYRIIKENQ
ncbi:MAG: electron transfer flavoprotein subunit beta/FixA family protein [Desulfobacter sp.]